MDDSDRSPESILELTKEYKLGGRPSTTTTITASWSPNLWSIDQDCLSPFLVFFFMISFRQSYRIKKLPSMECWIPRECVASCVEQSQWTPLWWSQVHAPAIYTNFSPCNWLSIFAMFASSWLRCLNIAILQRFHAEVASMHWLHGSLTNLIKDSFLFRSTEISYSMTWHKASLTH